ncbi:MAG: rhodanese-like domain-containing protein [Erythrobacter sp.]
MRGAALAVMALELAACSPAIATEDAANEVAAAPAAEVVAVTPAELSALLDQGNIRLIDVRTYEEVAQGMIAGAEHIPLDRFDPATLDRSDGREVVLYCWSGRRSGIAAEKLAAETGEPVRHLEGGILAWEAADLPVAAR